MFPVVLQLVRTAAVRGAGSGTARHGALAPASAEQPPDVGRPGGDGAGGHR